MFFIPVPERCTWVDLGKTLLQASLQDHTVVQALEGAALESVAFSFCPIALAYLH